MMLEMAEPSDAEPALRRPASALADDAAAAPEAVPALQYCALPLRDLVFADFDSVAGATIVTHTRLLMRQHGSTVSGN